MVPGSKAVQKTTKKIDGPGASGMDLSPVLSCLACLIIYNIGLLLFTFKILPKMVPKMVPKKIPKMIPKIAPQIPTNEKLMPFMPK